MVQTLSDLAFTGYIRMIRYSRHTLDAEQHQRSDGWLNGVHDGSVTPSGGSVTPSSVFDSVLPFFSVSCLPFLMHTIAGLTLLRVAHLR